MPAKLYEYIGAGNYIISLVKGVESNDLSHLDIQQSGLHEVRSFPGNLSR
jgi:hypothetical protein